MSAESREWSDCTDTDWAGVQNGGKGGLEFRVVRTSKQSESIRTNVCNGLSISDGSSSESNGSIGSHSSAGLSNKNANGFRRKNSSSKYKDQQLYLYVYPIQEIVNENYNNRNEDLDFFN